MASFDTNNGAGVKVGVATTGVVNRAPVGHTQEGTAGLPKDGLVIQYNHIVNPFFDADNKVPNAFYINNRQNGHNGAEADNPQYGGDPYPKAWSKVNALFNAHHASGNLDFQTYGGHYFLSARKVYDSPLDRDGDYRDVAQVAINQMAHSVGNNSTLRGDFPNSTHFSDLSIVAAQASPQPKILHIHGAGAKLDNVGVEGDVDTNGQRGRNNNLGRRWGDPSPSFQVLVGLHDSTLAASTIEATDTYGSSGNSQKCWVRHEWGQGVKIPTFASHVRFGCFVQVPKGDEIASGNLGGFYIKSHYNTGPAAYTELVKADTVVFKPTSGFHDIFHTSTSDQFMWSGAKSTQPSPRGYTFQYAWTTNQTTTGTKNDIGTELADGTDTTEFQVYSRHLGIGSVGSTFGGGGQDLYQPGVSGDSEGTTRYLWFGMYFAEACSNLDSQYSGGGSGAIRFYQPFVQFFESGGNIIRPYLPDGSAEFVPASTRIGAVVSADGVAGAVTSGTGTYAAFVSSITKVFTIQTASGKGINAIKISGRDLASFDPNMIHVAVRDVAADSNLTLGSDVTANKLRTIQFNDSADTVNKQLRFTLTVPKGFPYENIDGRSDQDNGVLDVVLTGFSS